jgi:hypothetical protein
VPAATDGFIGDTLIDVNPVVVPVPERLTVCGLLFPLSVIVSVPVRVPTMVGVNVTLIVHLAPAANEVPQLLVWAKSPVVEMLLMVSVVV